MLKLKFSAIGLIFFIYFVAIEIDKASAVYLQHVQSDYFEVLKPLLRKKLMSCGNEELREKCATKCYENYACMFGKCICLNGDEYDEEFYKRNKKTNADIKNLRINNDYQVDDESIAIAILPSAQNTNNHPALRHHIAHFCPQLDEARECITKCMKVGKPAFCGKDHVCYCGHKYDHSLPDKKVNPKDIYAQFKDLYEKYFGKQKNKPTSKYDDEDDEEEEAEAEKDDEEDEEKDKWK